MDLEDQLLLQRLSSRVAELEGWIALFAIMHGTKNGHGFRYSICSEHALEFRRRLGSTAPAVAIEYDPERDRHIIDVL